MKPIIENETITKVDLSKPPKEETDAVQEPETNASDVTIGKSENSKDSEKVVEEVRDTKENEDTVQNEETPVLEEVTEEKVGEQVEEIAEEASEAIKENLETGEPLPENIQKLMDFMEETGGDLNDYVNLNRDVEKMDDSDVLDEYYRTTKSHLSPEERNFLLQDSYGYDEDEDDAKEIKKKKIALKEQVAEARAHLDGQKSKYYEEIKAGSKLTQEQQEAINFFNRYNKESEEQKKLSETSKLKFQQKTNNVFNENFKGFDFKVGEKKFRFNVKDTNKVKETQSDINNFVNKFVGEDKSTIEDAAGYHKSLFTAMNADVIAKHFYEQGKADATKARVAKDKNINTEPRKTHGETNVGGVKYKVLGDTSSDVKNRSFKIKKKN